MLILTLHHLFLKYWPMKHRIKFSVPSSPQTPSYPPTQLLFSPGQQHFLVNSSFCFPTQFPWALAENLFIPHFTPSFTLTLCNTVAAGHMWLLSPGHVASPNSVKYNKIQTLSVIKYRLWVSKNWNSAKTKNVKYLLIIFILISCWNDQVLDIFD